MSPSTPEAIHAREHELRVAYKDAAQAHTNAQTRTKLTRNAISDLTAELNLLPEHGRRRIADLQEKAGDLFNAKALASGWFADLTTRNLATAPVPPAELAVLHLVASDSTFTERLLGVIDVQQADRRHAGFTRRSRKQIEDERAALVTELPALEKAEAKADEAKRVASTLLARWSRGEQVERRNEG
jgi:hypothetical protein